MASAVAAALSGAATTAAAREPVLPLRNKPAKASPGAAAGKRGKQARSSLGTQLCRAVALLVVAAFAAAGAVGWYAASILHERPAALAAATAEAQAAARSAAATAPAAQQPGSSGLLAGNYTVVVMSCE